MMMIRTAAALAALLAASAIAAPPARPAAAGLKVLADSHGGLYELREQDRPTRRICIADASALQQIAHVEPACGRYVLEDSAASATIQYRCAGTGGGRTVIRREESALAIESQGIIHGAPFAFSVDAMRVGDCHPAGFKSVR